ncbi:MAG: hypothetical protein QM780_11885 [Hyphomicrobium sp.]|uniref:hypothetical protein n=1 Tax=Hyphomicrobium sp. TaxID=82 RepID=UPI0039E6DBA3
MRGLLLALAVALSSGIVTPLEANQQPRAKSKHTWQKPRLRADRDCVPINGPYGYYGNPWCDTGSSRPPDIEFRERHRLQNR